MTFFKPEYIWFVLSIVLFAVEAATVNIVTVWFGIGALAAMIVAFCTGNYVLQIITFLAVSAILLVFTRPLAKKYIIRTPTNSDSIIGKTAIVTKEIDNLEAMGEVKINGTFWSARNIDDGNIAVGEKVLISNIEGVKLIVKKI